MEYHPPINGDTNDADRGYINGDRQNGIEGSIPDAKGIEYPQREIINAIASAGLVPDDADLTQLAQAIAASVGRGYASTGAYASTSTSIPFDDTIPQDTEGAEALSIAYTPKSATSKLLVSGQAQLQCGSNYKCGIALFQNGDADAKATAWGYATTSSWPVSVGCTALISPATTDEITLSMRYGASSSNCYLNGNTSARLFGGVSNTYINIIEFK